MMRNPHCALGVVLLLASCTSTGSAPQGTPAPRFTVENGFIRDGDGRAVILRGLNLAGVHKFAPYLDFHQREDVLRVRRDWGMDSVRFLLTWAAVMPERGVVDQVYLEKVRQRLDWAAEAGVLVVLDMHQDVFGEGFQGGDGAPAWACDEARYAAFMPAAEWYLSYLDENVVACFDALWTDPALQALFADAWAAVARAFKDHPAVIGFDVLNEPWLGSFSIDRFEPDALQPFYEQVVPAVRREAPDWIAFLEPSSMRNLGQVTRLQAFPFPGVAYAPHSYETSAERGEGFDPARVEPLRMNIRALAEEARALGAALWVGEFGGQSGLPNHGLYLSTTLAGLDEAWAGSAVWEYGRNNGYGVLHPDGAEKEDTMAVLVRPSVLRLDGEPGTWTYDATTTTLHFTYTARGRAPTEVSLPPRLFPSGARVTCAACTVTAQSGGTLLLEAPPGAAVDVVVRPG